MNRFAQLLSDSESGSETEQEVERKEYHVPYVPAHVQQQISREDDTGFATVPKKKTHQTKVVLKNKAVVVAQHDQKQDHSKLVKNGLGQAACANLSGMSAQEQLREMGYNMVEVSPKSRSEYDVSSPDGKNAGGKVAPKKVNNRFACLEDSDAEKAEESSEESDDLGIGRPMPDAVQRPVMLRKRDQGVPDLFMCLSVTQTAVDGKKKGEITSIGASFLNSKTLKSEVPEFFRFVRPTENAKLSDRTTSDTGIQQADVDKNGQPIDEVMRELERFMKNHSLVSVNRTKKPKGNRMSQKEHEFIVVTDGPDDIFSKLKPELTRKQLAVNPAWKKSIDLRKAFCDVYNLEKATLEDMLQNLCLEDVPALSTNPRLTKKLEAVLTKMLEDAKKLEPNQEWNQDAKDENQNQKKKKSVVGVRY